MQALTSSWQAVLHAFSSHSGARPISPANVYVTPPEILVSLRVFGSAQRTRYSTVLRPSAVVMRPFVTARPLVVARPFVTDRPLIAVRPFVAARSSLIASE